MGDNTSAARNGQGRSRAKTKTLTDEQRVARLEEGMDRVEGKLGQIVELVELADSRRELEASAGHCSCASCTVLLPLLLAGERQAGAEMVEQQKISEDWENGLFVEPDKAIDEEWDRIYDQIRKLPGGQHLAHAADMNRGAKLCDGTVQGLGYGAALLVRQLQRRYEVANATAS